MKFLTLCILIGSQFAVVTHASEDPPLFQELNRLPRHPISKRYQRELSPSEIYQRTEAVLDHFGVPTMPALRPDFFDAIVHPSAQDDRLRYLQISNDWQRFANLPSVFKDRDSKNTIDFLTPRPQISDSSQDFLALPRSLNGLRVALDPGHMGGSYWDEKTGKFVKGKNGKILSEGIMALQISLLLEERLTRQGAVVMLTHRLPTSVTSTRYEDLRLRPIALEQLRESMLADWFLDLLNTAPPSPQLYQAFEKSPAFQKLFSEFMRNYYFVRKEDLEARVKRINEFKPDVTLVIHLDADDGVGGRWTKAYIPGGYFSEEFSTQELRSNFAWHYLNRQNWDQSLLLSRSVVRSIQRNMGVALQPAHGSNAVLIEPGVFARNMPLTRKIKSPVCFIECLFYDYPAEFEALSKQTHPFTIGGQSYPYSDRLVQIVDSLEQGIQDYVKQSAEIR